MTILHDGTITLRPPEPADAPVLAAAVQTSLNELAPWMPWASRSYNEAAALDWISGTSEEPFLITDTDGEVVGTCGLNRFDEADKRANLGYWIRSDRTGRGLATAAARLVARHGLGARRLVRIEIVMAVENHASRSVAERVGAEHEGVLRDRLLLHGQPHDAHSFSITAGWSANDQRMASPR
jgi:RimJ/RimL family protein N-acetyltransferase